MKNLKKKISIILFKQQIQLNSFIFIIPGISFRLFSKEKITAFHGIKYIFLKNNLLALPISNILYSFLNSKVDLLKIIIQYKNLFYGFKFKNLFFTFNTIQKYNYLQFFNLNNFLFNLKTFYFFFIKYIFTFKKILIKN